MAMPLAVRFPNMSYCVFTELSILRSLKLRRGMPKHVVLCVHRVVYIAFT